MSSLMQMVDALVESPFDKELIGVFCDALGEADGCVVQLVMTKLLESTTSVGARARHTLNQATTDEQRMWVVDNLGSQLDLEAIEMRKEYQNLLVLARQRCSHDLTEEIERRHNDSRTVIIRCCVCRTTVKEVDADSLPPCQHLETTPRNEWYPSGGDRGREITAFHCRRCGVIARREPK